MEAGFIRFDPASEFEIIETLDFQEEVQRPESLRFFTLEEQLLDYFDKVLPKKGKVTKFEYNRISTQVDRLREIYNDVITVTDTDYVVDTFRKQVNVDWVKPIYAPFSLEAYSYAEKWNPLYKPGLRTTPNYYPRMLAALPKPYRPTSSEGVPYTGTATMLNEDGEKPVNVLGIYERTRGIIHEDGSFSVVKLPIGNTADEMRVKGFYIEKRPVDIPIPLAEHPFLASTEPHSYLTEEPLNRVFPTLETIMTHAVPTTSDPYKEGTKFLKVYDVKLSQIPWNLWKERFPPVGTIAATPEIKSVSFPKSEDTEAPSKTLQDIYIRKWMSGFEPRFWLTQQEDGGSVVSKMLLTKASKSGLLTPAIVDKPVAQSVKSTPEECFQFDTFDSFVNTGLYRKGSCIPIPQIIQEKADTITAGKIAWKETTATDILRDHQELLKYFQYKEAQEKAPMYEKHASKGESELRRLIKAVLGDPERDPVDKASAIQLLLIGVTQKDEQWFDSDDSFLLCGHTLALLRGDLEVDKDAYYKQWTAVDDGFRACKHCGEQINRDVFIAQDDFDENGNVIISYDVLDMPSAFKGDTHVESFSNSLSKLRSSFTLDNSGEAIFYLLLSLLQVLPTESQLIPIIQFIRDLTGLLRANKKIEKSTKERIEGILGIVGMVTLLLTHNPFLIPRRSFGSKVLRLSGFPRDTDDSDDAPALDIVISVLKTTFEASPNTFKGPIATIMRQIIAKPKDVRKEAVSFLKQTIKKFEAQYLSSKERYASPEQSKTESTISVGIIRREKTVYTPSEKVGEEELMSECNIDIPRAYLTGRLPPNIVQEQLTLYPAKPSPLAEYIEAEYVPHRHITFTEADIRKRLSLGFPKGLKLPKIEEFIRSDTDGVALSALLNRILDILASEGFSIERIAQYRAASIYLKTGLLRDAIRGVLYEILHEIVSDKNRGGLVSELSTRIQRDLAFNMILITKEQAARQDSDLRTRERETFKLRMRNMNDTEREVTKMLLDIGIAPYIITNEDREIFAREYGIQDPELEHDRIEQEQDIDRPEEGYNAERDVEDDAAAVVNGVEQQVDYGDYGDRREEPQDRDYERNYWTSLDEDYGV